MTGGTGYLGGLIAATLLLNEEVHLVVPHRTTTDTDDFLRPVRQEVALQGADWRTEYDGRVHTVPLPALDDLSSLDPVVAQWEVDEVIHCAGCLDYFDTATLHAVNVELTRSLLDRSRRWRIGRFVYLSSAFSSGYRAGLVPEAVHEENGARHPTEYTRTKAEAERLVASSDIASLILRPSIVVGDSRDGHYGGKRYGLYQLWMGMERLLFDRWRPELHLVAPCVPTHFVHQDAFQAAFLAAYRYLPEGVMNLVSEPGPTLRAVTDLWMGAALRPQRVFYYSRIADVPVRQIDLRQRSLLALASVNLEIASHHWQFETSRLASLRGRGLTFADTTPESLAVCQELFIEESAKIQAFIAANEGCFPTETTIVERYRHSSEGTHAEVACRSAAPIVSSGLG